jgi:EPS-associated MarR family transcriptional regulator
MSQDESHLKVLKILEANPHMNQRSLSEALGVSLGKTNYCIKALLDKGCIKVQNFRTHENKLAYAYLLTPEGIKKKSELTFRFLKQKMADYEALKNEIEILKQESKSELQKLGELPIE